VWPALQADKIIDHVYLIDTRALGLSRTVAAYLLVGDEVALIDMGYRSSVRTIRQRMNELGIRRLDYLLPTHVHLDHCGSCGTLATEFIQARVLAHPTAVKHLIDPSRLIAGATEIFGQELVNRYGLPDPIAPNRVASIPAGQTINLGRGLVLKAVWTPGHAPHQVSYELEGKGILFTGDAVGVTFPDVPVLIPTTPPPSFDLGLAVDSLKLLNACDVKQLCTPHFGALTNAKDELAKNINKLMEWRNKIVELRSAGYSVDSLVGSLIDDVARQAGVRASEIPDYLQVLMRVNVLGFVQYLDRKS